MSVIKGAALLWRLPISLSCPTHGCLLQPALQLELAWTRQTHPPATPAGEHVLALDRRTYQGWTTGRVNLPRRAVHVGVWLRLLRSLLDELAVAPSRVGARSRETLQQVWAATGRPIRGGLSVWQPFEQLDWPRQEAMLDAAALALQLAETGAITARGTLGPLLSAQAHQPVYDGDELAAQFQRARRQLDELITAARTDPEAARRLLGWVTPGGPLHDQLRRSLINDGVPAEFLVAADAT